jgi:hypothetical protein
MTAAGIPPELRDRYAAVAEQAAAAAPEIRPGDDIALALQGLFAEFPAQLAERRKQQEPGHAA